MKVCNTCKYAECVSAVKKDDDPRAWKCTNEHCIDPIIGFQIMCLEARNLPMFCGNYGDFYEAKEEQDSSENESTIIT